MSAKSKAIAYICNWTVTHKDRRQYALTEKNLVGKRICRTEQDAIRLIYELVGEGMIEYKTVFRPYKEIVALPKCFSWKQAKKEKRQQMLSRWIPIVVSILALVFSIVIHFSGSE